MRPIKFDMDLEMIYSEMFEPMTVSRAQFKKLVGGSGVTADNGSGGTGGTSQGAEAPANNNAIAQIISLHTGEEH